MSPATYNISEQTLSRSRQRTKGLLAVLPVIFLIMGAFILSSSARGIQTSIGWALLGTLVVLEGLLFATASFVRRTMEGLSISISDDAIERRSDGRAEKMPFNEIRSVSVTYDSAMKVTGIQVTGKRRLGWILNGFENLDGLALALEAALDAERIRRRTAAFDTESLGCFAVMVIFGVAVGLLFVGLGRDVFQTFYIVFFGFYGLYSLVHRPYTGMLGQRLVWFEIIGAGFLLAASIWLGLQIF